MLRRLRHDEGGFQLVEVLIAMVVLVFGVMAIVAGFSSAMVSLINAGKTSTAATVADRQMEAYRALQYSAIGLDPVRVAAADSHYTGDAAFSATQVPGSTATCLATAAPDPPCPSRTVTGPDGGSYRIDTYITEAALTDGAGVPIGREVKTVTVVVRSGTTPAKVLFRETSTFDRATGGM